jgi:hypothetical protein
VLRALILLFTLSGTLHSAGTIFSTVLSGLGEEFASAVASDAQGNTYVAGLTYSPDFPATPGAWQTALAGTDDAFVARIGPDGKVIWTTYLGGILDDFATGIAVDGAGNVLVTGYTRSANFPLVNPIQSTQTGFVAFVAKLDPTGSKLLYSTFLGGMGETGGGGIAVDSAGNAYIAANTLGAAGYPGLPQTIYDPSGIVVSKLTPQGALVYSYLYPNGIAQGIAVDATGAVYVAGSNGYDPMPWSSSSRPMARRKSSRRGSAAAYRPRRQRSQSRTPARCGSPAAPHRPISRWYTPCRIRWAPGRYGRAPIAAPPGRRPTICPSRFRKQWW